MVWRCGILTSWILGQSKVSLAGAVIPSVSRVPQPGIGLYHSHNGQEGFISPKLTLRAIDGAKAAGDGSVNACDAESNGNFDSGEPISSA